MTDGKCSCTEGLKKLIFYTLAAKSHLEGMKIISGEIPSIKEIENKLPGIIEDYIECSGKDYPEESPPALHMLHIARERIEELGIGVAEIQTILKHALEPAKIKKYDIKELEWIWVDK